MVESPISSLVASDQDYASPVAFEVSDVSDTLPIILSIQPPDSRALGGEPYDINWNPIWENLEEEFPFTPLGVSVAMSSSYMDETTPVTGEENLVSSGQNPLPMEGFPFHSGLGVTFPLGYHALFDIMSSMSLNRSSVWSRTIAPTLEPFILWIHNVSITSIPSMPTICVASTVPTVSVVVASSVVTTIIGPLVELTSGGPSASTSGIVNPTGSIPLSSGSILAGWSYEQYMFSIQNLDLHNPLHFMILEGLIFIILGPSLLNQ